MTLQQSLGAMLIPSADPGMHAGAINLETLRDLSGGFPLHAEHDGLQAQGHTGRFFGLSFLAKRFEASESSGIALSEDRLHGQKPYVVLLIRTEVDHASTKEGKKKRAP